MLQPQSVPQFMDKNTLLEAQTTVSRSIRRRPCAAVATQELIVEKQIAAEIT